MAFTETQLLVVKMITHGIGVYDASAGQIADDLARETYGLLGLPIDAADRACTLANIREAAKSRKRWLLSTPNVNFMAESQRDVSFRETLLQSDHCCPDGMPIVWLSRLLGVPMKERVSGSDLFESLRAGCSNSEPLKVFLFGGGAGTAEVVCNLLNAQPSAIRCVGYLNPGFGSVDEMSEPSILDQINGSQADFLAVFLSAKKAQRWLHRNHSRLQIPVRGQFGSTINYQAGIVRRAPRIVQRLGFEWLWRIKEEPHLWRRYWSDGALLVRLVITRALPIALEFGWQRWFSARDDDLSFWKIEQENSVLVGLMGSATKTHVTKAITFFRTLLLLRRDIVLDLSKTQEVDARFFGLLLMFRKELKEEEKQLKFTGLSARARRIFRLSGFEFLLEPGPRLESNDPRADVRVSELL
ncbi:WecB/TagA/CpsF family glycosyltransferase [Bradyrhizobium genosp. P]|uniref:WecB/TagA/CpsF family glycosyltransferase n=1 Tax=Bradyrhizobium genosp. P TaxID=83641 RepID=UPI003CEECADB